MGRGYSRVSGLLLTLIGYSQATAFDTDVVNGIYDITCLVPAIGYILLAFALIYFYPLNKKRVEENARVLAEKNHSKNDKAAKEFIQEKDNADVNVNGVAANNHGTEMAVKDAIVGGSSDENVKNSEK